MPVSWEQKVEWCEALTRIYRKLNKLLAPMGLSTAVLTHLDNELEFAQIFIDC